MACATRETGGTSRPRPRSLSDEDILHNVVFKRSILRIFSRDAAVITDDNQLLSYGYGRMRFWTNYDFLKINIEELQRIADDKE